MHYVSLRARNRIPGYLGQDEMSDMNRRLKKIEKTLEPESKGLWLRFPLPDGTFIEAPGCRNLMEVLALAGMGRREQTMDESGRN